MNIDSPQIKALKQGYKKSLPEKAQIIENFRDQLEANNGSAMQQTHDYLHKLAGSAGMYGFDEISKHCRQAMDCDVGDELMAKLVNIQSLLLEHADS